MRQMRSDARDLAQKEEELGPKLDALADTKRKTLSDTPERKEVAQQLDQQKSKMENLVNEMRRVTEQAEWPNRSCPSNSTIPCGKPLRRMHDNSRKPRPRWCSAACSRKASTIFSKAPARMALSNHSKSLPNCSEVAIRRKRPNSSNVPVRISES